MPVFHRSYISVLPTHVGMVRAAAADRLPSISSPHTRGDGPEIRFGTVTVHEFSPHTWGWSDYKLLQRDPVAVLPTHVGMVAQRATSNSL